MAIDINALRKFQETWSPVMDAIPAVMDMVAKQADMDRSMAKARDPTLLCCGQYLQPASLPCQGDLPATHR